MPSGPDGYVADPKYRQEFEKARGLVLGHPGRWRVIYHYDADGIASASSAMRAFARLGYPAQATALAGVERERMEELLRATLEPVLVVDTGATWLDLYGRHPHPVVVLDHHKYPEAPNPPVLPPHVAFVDPLNWGVDGMTEMCAATLTWLFTVFLDPLNWDNAPWGLSGAIGDRQHVGGFHGLNATLVDEAVARSQVVRRPGVALFGATMGAAITGSIDPFVRGLSGRPEAVGTFLDRLGIDPGRSPRSLTPDESRRLTEALRARLTEGRKIPPEALRVFDQERWFLPSLGLDAEEVSNLQSAAGRARMSGVGVAYALGDPVAAQRCRDAEETWRAGILKGLRRLEDEGVNSMRYLQWFESPELTLAGTQAGMAILYLLDPERPVFVFSAAPGPTKVSGRGTFGLIDRGLDLAVVCREAALAVQGEGGGHRIAAGATIPAHSRDRFLAEADRIVGGQIETVGERP